MSSKSKTDNKQRRGKKSSAKINSKLEEQLEKAENIVHQAKARAVQLHSQWRAHIFRLSLLVLLVSFHQSRIPMTECMKTIKSFNEENYAEQKITGSQATMLVLQDSMCEIMGILMMSALSRFLMEDPPGKFSNPFYLAATAFVPLQLAAYYNRKHLGCITEQETAAEEPATPRNFPVAPIFHAIVTACYYFMDKQMQGRDRDVQRVTALRDDLAKAQQGSKKKE